LRTWHTVSGRDQEQAIDLLLDERDYQDAKWGGPAHDDTEPPAAWVGYITEYLLGEGRAEGYSFAKRMVKVGALALAALEAEIRAGALDALEAELDAGRGPK
jgi:hypothetical protein